MCMKEEESKSVCVCERERKRERERERERYPICSGSSPSNSMHFAWIVHAEPCMSRVCERDRDRDRDRETEKERDRDREFTSCISKHVSVSV